jgi:hypothetical protein
VASFDRSRFKLLKLKFSMKSVQVPSCERPKSTLFLSCHVKSIILPISDIVTEVDEKIRETCKPCAHCSIKKAINSLLTV